MSDAELKLECLKLAYQEQIDGLIPLETAIVYHQFLTTVNYKKPTEKKKSNRKLR